MLHACHVRSRDVGVIPSRPCIQCRLTKLPDRLLQAASMRELGPPGMARAVCPPALARASRFPPPPRHSLRPLPTCTTHSLATTTTHHLFTAPDRAIPTSIIFAAVQNGQRLQQAQSKSRACITTRTAGRAYSDGEVVAHWVGGLRCDRARKHRSEHTQRRVTRAHRHCYQAAQT